jgi:hypothetical protein
VVLLCSVALVAAGCGGAKGDERAKGSGKVSVDVASGASSTSAPAGPRDAGGGTSPTPSGGGGRTTTTAVSRPPATRPVTTTSSAEGPTTPAGGSDAETTRAVAGAEGPPGSFARSLLLPRPLTGLVIERFAQEGASLGSTAVNHATRVLGDVTAKPVDVRPTAALGTGATDHEWTAEELRATADRSTKLTQGASGRAVVHLLLVRGTFEGNGQVLGVAVRGDVLALFTDPIAGAATPLVGRSTIEDAVLVHELGHLLGLVDLARDTGRADKDHPGHSSNRASVMFWAVESSLVGQVLDGPPPRDFDAADLADLKALREGA